MSQVSRMYVAAALCLLLTLVASAAVEPEQLDQLKQNVVRAVLERLGDAEANASIMDAAVGAEALVDIQLDVSSERPVVTLRPTGQPVATAFLLDDRKKLVVDLLDTVNLYGGEAIVAPDQSIVRRLRTSLFMLEPQFTSRVVVDLAKPCTFDLYQEEGLITIVLAPAATTSGCGATQTPTNCVEEPAGTAADLPVAAASVEGLSEPVATRSADHETEIALSRLDAELARIGSRPPEAAPEAGEAALPVDLRRVRDLAQSVWSATATTVTRAMEGFDIIARKKTEGPPRIVVAKSRGSVPTPHRTAIIAKGKPAKDPVTWLSEELEAVRMSQFDVVFGAPPRYAAVTEEETDESSTPSEETADAPEEGKGEPANASAEEDTPEAPAPPPPEKRRAEQEEPPKAAPRTRPVELEAVEAPEVALEIPQAQPLPPPIEGDPLEQIIPVVDFRESELVDIVALLAQKAQINVIAGTDVTGAVTASLRNVTLRRAMETCLRLNGLGLVEEEGIYRIVPYEEAQAANRITMVVTLDNAKAADVRTTLEDVLRGAPDDALTSVSDNEATNVIVLAGPEARVNQLRDLALELDIAEPVIPTVTEAIKINNAEPTDLVELVKGMLSPDIGQVGVDERGRHLVVTDVPVAVEQVRDFIKTIDLPVKQVSIDAMIVDAVLSDNSQTGVDWIFDSVRKQNRRGQTIGSLQNLAFETDSTGSGVTSGAISQIPFVSSLTLGVLTSDIDIKAAIAGEVQSNNAKLLANPVVVTVENKEATINITSEIPYQQITQSTTGPPMSTTEFKDIGIVLQVTPRVTHDDHVIAEFTVKQSDTKSEVNGIPVEDKRETSTTLRTKNGQTIFIAGLRRFDDEFTTKKTPILGDVPVLSFLFRNNVVKKQNTEILIFLTCNVLPEEIGELSPGMQDIYNELDQIPPVPHSQGALFRSVMKPGEMHDPAWKWRRSE